MKISDIVVNERFRKDLGKLVDLEQSIVKNGLLHAVVIDENNVLIAGERRLQAYKNLAQEDPKYNDIPVSVVSTDDQRTKETDENIIRLDFNGIETRAIRDNNIKLLGDEISQGTRTDLKKYVKCDGCEKRVIPEAGDGISQCPECGYGIDDLTSGNFPEVMTGQETRVEAAKGTGWSDRSIAKMDEIVAKMHKYPKVQAKWEKFNKTFHDVDSGKDKETLNRVYKELVRVENVQTQETVEIPKEKYQLLYCDPPWEYNGKSRNVELHYPSMTREELKDLDVAKLAHDDCVMLMWVTYPHLPEGLELLQAWGFTYKTVAFTWVKKNKSGEGYFMGLGNYTRTNAEICVIGVRGKGLTVKSKDVRQICDASVSKHSEKPAEIRDRIVELYGDVKRMEMFARKTTPGWETWGNEVK